MYYATKEQTPELIASKKAKAKAAYAVSSRIMELLSRAYDSANMSEEERVLWSRSVYSPQKRKHGEASASYLFWSDDAAVQRWMDQKNGVPILTEEQQ